MGTLERNQQAFSGQSQGFSTDGDTYADAEGLAWMLADLPTSPEAVALDVATGTGEFARALAPHVASVTGLDATDAMIDKGRAFVEENGIANISFEKGIVEEMPFESERFDIVATRYAFHHFAEPRTVLSEMARVCKKGGHVILVDIVTPELEAGAEYNYYEWLCDRSHTRCLGFDEMCKLFGLLGLDVVSARTRDIEEEVVEWMDFSLTRDEDRAEILRAVTEELSGGTKTGLAAYERDSVLYFRQRDASVVGRKLG